MTFGNLVQRPDLQPLFGQLSPEENERLVKRLLAVDARLVRLAEYASRHVGVPYEHTGLGLVVRADGKCAGIHGGPSGDAGDIWFDISPSRDPANGLAAARSWVVESDLIIFCLDSPEPRWDSNTHFIVSLEETGESPDGVLDILESHVSTMEAEIERRPPQFFTGTPHAELP